MKKIIIIASAAVALSAGVLASEVKTTSKTPELQTAQIQKVSISSERKDVATAD
jgi:hypothetical protein